MTESIMTRPVDWQERARAIDIRHSCIVQAPAGSGKTELLVQRILSLLAVVDTPEEVLSITFTRKAAGEMRLRLLQALERAGGEAPQEPYALETWQRARAVIEHDREKGWNLLGNPSRLQLMTIDSLCAFLTRRMPWLARFGESPGVTDDPTDLYQQAAESLLYRLEQGGKGQDEIEILLSHLDNRMSLLRDLLVSMLGRRDQWLRHLVSTRGKLPRQVLEDGLSLYVTSFIQQAYRVLGAQVYEELRSLACYAANSLNAENLDNPFQLLLDEADDPGSIKQWLALSQLVLTSAGAVRKSVNKRNGFPADKLPQAQEMKERAGNLLDIFHTNPEMAGALQALSLLPATAYEPGQWQVLESLVVLLPLAVIELQEVFRLKGVVDFIEVAGAAKAALGSVTEPEELLLQLDSRIQHILVDEFQDTSYAQYDLLRCLTAGWSPGEGRTLFVVGDPMQSIYRFREAEVGLYLRVCRRGLDSLPMERIILKTNFRSGKGLVDWANSSFAQVFPDKEDELKGAVTFAPAIAFDHGESATGMSFQTFVGRQDIQEAAVVVDLVRQAHAVDKKSTVAILVRSRVHLSAIVSALKEAHISYQAQDIDPLIDRQVVKDIVSLTRALCRPADRVAWLSLLRAPWCGLTLEDLTCICGTDARATIWTLLTQSPPQGEMFDYVSPDGRQRLNRILPVLDRAMSNLGRLPLRRIVESTWVALNGPACVDAADLRDAEQAFAMLDRIDREKGLDDLENRLGKLFAAPDPQAGPEVQLMTIHKAKGLEFDTVILPGLGRGVRGQDRALLRWLEHPDYELLLAPVPPLLDDQPEPTYKAIGHILQEKDDLETIRLLYVAVTRARKNLHLLGHVKENSKQELKPQVGSLLSVLWPACEKDFLSTIYEPSSAAEEKPAAPKIRRLPTAWQPPRMPDRLMVEQSHAQIASMGGHYDEDGFASRHTEEGRLIGTVVHAYLERIASEGLMSWSVERVKEEDAGIRTRLSSAGIPYDRLDLCAERVCYCLVNTLRSERGRWMLAEYREADNEMPINGTVDGQLVRATIDRTFVDNEGVRWVIDYKTSSPGEDESSDAFMQREAERYQAQLNLYASLLSQMDEPIMIRKALYFPAFDGWTEVT